MTNGEGEDREDLYERDSGVEKRRKGKKKRRRIIKRSGWRIRKKIK